MGGWRDFGVKTLTWKERLSEMSEDIGQYLERRYEGYCKDKNEKSSVSGGEDQLERHNAKKKRLIEFGIILQEKLNFFLGESRAELFERTISVDESLDKFFKDIYDKFCKELDETNKALPLYKQRDPYTLYIEKSDKEKQLFEYKEIMKNDRFVERIDKRRADYEKKKADREKREAEEKIKEERAIRRKGLSNVKPLSFYEEMYEDDNKEWIGLNQQKDIYFQEHGIPNEESIFSERLEIYIKIDTPEENQKHLNRCKEMKEIVDDLISQFYTFFKWLQDEDLFNVDILQEYLTKGYLVTVQIVELCFRIDFWLKWILSIDLNNPYHIIDNHPAKEYDFNAYKDNFDIERIKQGVAEFVRVNEGIILTPFECLKVYLKKHNNRITKKQYANFTGKSLYIASKELEDFEAEKKLKIKIEAKGLNVFYV